MVVVAKGLGRIMCRVCWRKCGHLSQKADCTDYIYTTYPLDSSSMFCVKHPPSTQPPVLLGHYR